MRALMGEDGSTLRLAPGALIPGQKYRRAKRDGAREFPRDTHVCASRPSFEHTRGVAPQPCHTSKANRDAQQKHNCYSYMEERERREPVGRHAVPDCLNDDVGECERSGRQHGSERQLHERWNRRSARQHRRPEELLDLRIANSQGDDPESHGSRKRQ